MYTVEYYSAIKRNTFESVLMRWMKLEPLIQSDVKSERDGNTRPPDLPLEKPVCRSGGNS